MSFDVESQHGRRRLQNPEMVPGAESGLVVLDEIQAKPEIFNVLRVLADRSPSPARFLVLGSASLDVVKRVSETQAGHVGVVNSVRSARKGHALLRGPGPVLRLWSIPRPGDAGR